MKKTVNPFIFLMLCGILSVLLAGCGGAEDTFRNARVISVSGIAGLLREENTMDVYEGLVLKGGDQITTGDNGRVDLKLDEDKYVVLEPGTTVTLELEGNARKGAIRLHQVSGTIHHTLENPLSEADSYEVHTPDAVMAVRGTDFITSVFQTEAGTQTTTEVQDGAVEMTPNNSQDPSQTLEPGESATAKTDSGEPSRFLIFCPVCDQEVEMLEAHLLSCGSGHYGCDGQDHGILPCEHFACAEGAHTTFRDCGVHYICAQGDHERKRACGHFVCAEGEHEETFACGHPVCQGGTHNRLLCGHYACDGRNHGGTYSCGHYTCLGGDHGLLKCGHRACQGGDHQMMDCGHRACKGGSHKTLRCGHYACDKGGSHKILSCGHYACDPADLEHATLSCGNYACRGGSHSRCYSCESCVCTGDHEKLSCGHLMCQGGTHDRLACGHYACAEGSHDRIENCGHYACDGQNHDTYHPCGYPLCAQGHNQLECGHCPSCHSAQDHTRLPCGHHACDGSAAGNHDQLSCGSYDCQSGHEQCGFCGSCTCTGTHGDGVCNVTG